MQAYQLHQRWPVYRGPDPGGDPRLAADGKSMTPPLLELVVTHTSFTGRHPWLPYFLARIPDGRVADAKIGLTAVCAGRTSARL